MHKGRIWRDRVVLLVDPGMEPWIRFLFYLLPTDPRTASVVAGLV